MPSTLLLLLLLSLLPANKLLTVHEFQTSLLLLLLSLLLSPSKSLFMCGFQTGATFPDTLVDKLAKSRKANAGGFNLRQIILGTFDQSIHTRGKADTQALFSQTYKDIMGIEPIPNTNMPANFGHLSKGYDAQYYGYLVSHTHGSCDAHLGQY